MKAKCEKCRKAFDKKRSGHVFCSRRCLEALAASRRYEKYFRALPGKKGL